MIKVSVLYPNGEGKRFDLDNYAKHLALVHARWDPMGLADLTVDQGIAGGAPDSKAPYAFMAHLRWETLEAFQAAFGAHGKEIMDDIPNFTDITPDMQISEIMPK